MPLFWMCLDGFVDYDEPTPIPLWEKADGHGFHAALFHWVENIYTGQWHEPFTYEEELVLNVKNVIRVGPYVHLHVFSVPDQVDKVYVFRAMSEAEPKPRS